MKKKALWISVEWAFLQKGKQNQTNIFYPDFRFLITFLRGVNQTHCITGCENIIFCRTLLHFLDLQITKISMIIYMQINLVHYVFPRFLEASTSLDTLWNRKPVVGRVMMRQIWYCPHIPIILTLAFFLLMKPRHE